MINSTLILMLNRDELMELVLAQEHAISSEKTRTHALEEVVKAHGEVFRAMESYLKAEKGANAVQRELSIFTNLLYEKHFGKPTAAEDSKNE